SSTPAVTCTASSLVADRIDSVAPMRSIARTINKIETRSARGTASSIGRVESTPMRRTIVLTLLLASALTADTPPPKPIFGFADPAKQHALEARFDASLSRENQQAWLKRLAARPHHVGSPYGKENAEF